MKYKKYEKIRHEILKENPTEAGIALAMLCWEYIQNTNATEKDFIKSLKESFKIIKEKQL